MKTADFHRSYLAYKSRYLALKCELRGGVGFTIEQFANNLNPILSRSGYRVEYQRGLNPTFTVYNSENRRITSFKGHNSPGSNTTLTLNKLYEDLPEDTASLDGLTLDDLPVLKGMIMSFERRMKSLRDDQIVRLVVLLKRIGARVTEGAYPKTLNIKFYDGQMHHAPGTPYDGAQMYYIKLNVNLSERFNELEMELGDDELMRIIKRWIEKEFDYRRQQTDSEIQHHIRRTMSGEPLL
jgi:hypothetical protein